MRDKWQISKIPISICTCPRLKPSGRLDSYVQYVHTWRFFLFYFFIFGDDVQYTLTGESIIERQLWLSPCDTNYDNSPYINLDLSGRGFSWAGDW